jgi:hypothetical protein
MSSDKYTSLVLDDFTFSGIEVPEQITFGGEQAMVTHRLVGGAKVIDAMGGFAEPLSWSGMFIGPQALDRARYLDQKRVAGKAVNLRWSELAYNVVIREFHADYQRQYRIPYRIICEVVADLAQPLQSLYQVSMDTLMNLDAAACVATSAQVASAGPIVATGASTSSLSSAMASVNSAISAVSTFATATQTQLNAILKPVAAARTQVGILLASVNNTLGSVTTLGGLLPNNPLSTQVAGLAAQVTAATQQPLLMQLDRTLGRIATNASSNYQSSKVVTVAGGNLYQIAAQEYGDPTAWTGIARANGLRDPVLPPGVNTIVIPPLKDNAGGVLSS